MQNQLMWILIILVLIVFLALWINIIFFEEGECQEQEVRAIIGEAADQGYQGMLAVACGIRNRGSLRGVYGTNAAHIGSEPQWVWEMAQRAWIESQENRIHTGTHWGSTKCDQAWIRTMEKEGYQLVYEHRDHKFYKK